MTSSEKREGREDILDYIEKIVEGQTLTEATSTQKPNT